jgi:hypothetical protein
MRIPWRNPGIETELFLSATLKRSIVAFKSLVSFALGGLSLICGKSGGFAVSVDTAEFRQLSRPGCLDPPPS